MKLLIALITSLAAITASTAAPLQVGPWPGDETDDVHGLRLGMFSENHSLYGVSLSLLTDSVDGDSAGLRIALVRVVAQETFRGLSLAALNMDYHMQGVQLGLFVGGYRLGSSSETTRELEGLQAGIGCIAQEANGLQIGLAGNSARHLHGIQIGGILNDTEHGNGLQVALCNGDPRNFDLNSGTGPDTEFSGLQLGMINLTASVTGAQCGILNTADEVHGFQLGLLNMTRMLHGVQIGVLNIVGEGSPGFLPLVNARF